MQTIETQMKTGEEPVEAKLIGCVRTLLDSGERLKRALVSRDVDEIWSALGEQEEHASMLNEYAALWQELAETTNAAREETIAAKRRTIRLEMKRLQALQRANSMLAQSFLSAVRKAIQSVETSATKSPVNTYSKQGRQRGQSASRLVRRFG